MKIDQQKLPKLKYKEKTNKQTNKKQPQNIHKLWDNFKRCNTCIIGILEEEEREIGWTTYLNGRELSKIDTKPQIQEDQRTPSRINTLNSCTQTYRIQIKENQRQIENLEKSQRNKTPYLQKKKKITVDFSSETLSAGNEWSEILTCLREKTNNLELHIQ